MNSNNRIKIGRALECEFNIPETYSKVSNEHADICVENGVVKFSDHSSNGTMINGRNVHNEEVVVKQGDKIILANEFEIKWNEIERFFPSLHRATERFDGSQVNVGGQKTEMFDGSQIVSSGKETERFDGNNVSNESGRKTESIGSQNGNEQIRGQVNEFSQAEIEELTETWNIGAFLGSWVWALKYRIYWPVAIIVVSFIPYIGQICSLFICTYLGLNGNRLAWDKSKDHNFSKFVAEQKKWVWLGAILFVVFTAIQCYALYVIL